MAWVTKSSTEQYNTESTPPRQYTRQEKAANWWHYHRVMVVILAVVAAILIWLAVDILTKVEPDYQIGWVGKSNLPQDTVDALEQALAAYGTDRNGDGQIVVQVNQYAVDLTVTELNDSADPYNQMAGMTRLSADLSQPDSSSIFLLEDPAAFQAATAGLEYLDGTLPQVGAEDWQRMVYRWSDCPVLAGLALGDYTGLNALDSTTGSSQELLSGVYVGFRGARSEEDTQSQEASRELWDALTAGAQPLEDTP